MEMEFLPLFQTYYMKVLYTIAVNWKYGKQFIPVGTGESISVYPILLET